MSFQTCKTFVHLQNTNEDVLDLIQELSDPPIDSKGPYTFKAQKSTKNIVWNVMKQREYFLGENPPKIMTFFNV